MRVARDYDPVQKIYILFSIGSVYASLHLDSPLTFREPLAEYQDDVQDIQEEGGVSCPSGRGPPRRDQPNVQEDTTSSRRLLRESHWVPPLERRELTEVSPSQFESKQ
jgi:hypothetical protein